MTPRSRRAAVALATVAAMAIAGCSSSRATTTATTATTKTVQPPPKPSLGVVATRDALNVAHDNEVMALATQGRRLFAVTDQWEYAGPSPHGQVLVKNAPDGPWQVFEPTESVRVQALASFPIPADQGLGPGHSLLVTQAIVHGRSVIQWLLDDAPAFRSQDAFVLASAAVDVRSFGAHEDHGVWSVFAGTAPTGVLRGTWSRTRHTLQFDPVPEVRTAPPGSPGLKTQKVTAFAQCAGALYVTINTRLFRRNDGPLASGAPRWTLVYQEPPVGAFNSGLRGLTCVTHAAAPALLVSTEGTGDIERFDDLPSGTRPTTARRLVPHVELAPIPAIARILAAHGTHVPTRGTGSIGYVIAAYNDFTTVELDGATRQLFGFEWAYSGACPATRTCGPTSFGLEHFDAAACFAVRTDTTTTAPTFDLHCLDGPDFVPTPHSGSPIRGGDAFTSIRTIAPSPFSDGALYFAGYDCNFFPADGTAWIAHAPTRAIHLDLRPSEESP